MNANKLFYRAEVYNFIMIYALASSAYLSVTLLDTNLPQVSVFLVLVGLELISYLSRRHVNKMVLYLLVHLAEPIAFIFIPMNPVGIMTAALAWIVFLMLDLYAWGKVDLYGFMYVPILMELPVAIFYFLSYLADKPLNSYLIFILGVLYFVLYYLREANINLYRLSMEGREDGTMPLDVIRKNNFRILLPPLLLSACVMLLTKADGLNDRIYTFLKKVAGVILLVIYTIGFLIEKFFTDLLGSYEEDWSVMEKAKVATQDQPSLAADILDYLIMAAIIGVTGFVVFKIVKSIIDSIEAKEEGSVENITCKGMVEIREKLPRKKTKDDRGLSKIRREYKHKIERAAKSGYDIKVGQTPAERATDMKQSIGEDISELTLLYEAERYGKIIRNSDKDS